MPVNKLSEKQMKLLNMDQRSRSTDLTIDSDDRHMPELPVFGPNSYKLGLALWDHMSIALTLEILLVVAGLILYLNGASTGFSARFGILILMDSVFRIDGCGDDIIRATESHGPVSFVARDTTYAE